MPVIIMEKMCSDEPDMYIIIAFIGILPGQHRKGEGVFETSLPPRWRFPMLS